MSATIHGRVLAKAYHTKCLRRPPAASISNRYSPPSRGLGASRYFLTSPTASPSQGRRLRLRPSFANGLAPPSRGRGNSPVRQFDGRSIKNNVRTNFSYAGPRKLSDILKTDLLSDKSSAEVSAPVCQILCFRYSTSFIFIFSIDQSYVLMNPVLYSILYHTKISDLWIAYHKGKENVHGLTLDKTKGNSVLSRAAQCPFFVHPVFREEGHFMIISQFQTPNYFLLAFLEDYQIDPARAQPLLTISIFDDLAESKGVTLVRCDVINRGIADGEGYNICKYLLDDYADDGNFGTVHLFNKRPDAFDVGDFVREKEQRWKGSGSGRENAGDGVIEAVTGNKSIDAV